MDAAQLAEFKKFKELIAELKEKNGEFAEMEIDEIVQSWFWQLRDMQR